MRTVRPKAASAAVSVPLRLAFPQWKISRFIVYANLFLTGIALALCGFAVPSAWTDSIQAAIPIHSSFRIVFITLFRQAALEAGIVLALAFCVFGELYTGCFFILKGYLLGVQAISLSQTQTAQGLIYYAVGIAIPNVLCFFGLLWIAEAAGRISRRLLHQLLGITFNCQGRRREIEITLRRYCAVLLGNALADALGAWLLFALKSLP